MPAAPGVPSPALHVHLLPFRFPHSSVRSRTLVATCLLAALAACGSNSESPASAPGFAFHLRFPGDSAFTLRGDSAYWDVSSLRAGPALSAFMTSPDSVGGHAPPTNFYLVQLLPDSAVGLGTYSLVPLGATTPSFSLSYPNPSGPAYAAVSDSGTITFQSLSADSVITGSVDAWVTQYAPTAGPSYQVTGQFRLPPRR